MNKSKFDIVIGNPPYLNVDDTWGKKDSRLKALKTLYPHIYNDKTDILFYFIAKAVELSKGYVGYIVSRAFLEAYKANKLRGFLTSKSCIQTLIDFRNYYVFPGVGITTCILIFTPNMPQRIFNSYKLKNEHSEIFDLSKQLKNINLFENNEVSQAQIDDKPWTFNSKLISELNKKIDSMGEPLSKSFIIGKGMETGRNDIFGKKSKEQIIGWGLNKGMFYKRATNSDIQRYFIRDRAEYILYLENINNFKDIPIGVQKYLLENRAELEGRAAYVRGDCEWWKFTWPLHKEIYNRRRIVCPYMASRNRFAIDDQKQFLSLTDTTVLFENYQPEDIKYFLGLLNSKLLTFRFRTIGKLKSGGIFEYFWNSVAKLPIRRIDFKNPSEKSQHDKMGSLVENILYLYKCLGESKTQSEKELYQGQIASTDEKIDKLVYELYGLSEQEIKIVEGIVK